MGAGGNSGERIVSRVEPLSDRAFLEHVQLIRLALTDWRAAPRDRPGHVTRLKIDRREVRGLTDVDRKTARADDARRADDLGHVRAWAEEPGERSLDAGVGEVAAGVAGARANVDARVGQRDAIDENRPGDTTGRGGQIEVCGRRFTGDDRDRLLSDLGVRKEPAAVLVEPERVGAGGHGSQEIVRGGEPLRHRPRFEHVELIGVAVADRRVVPRDRPGHRTRLEVERRLSQVDRLGGRLAAWAAGRRRETKDRAGDDPPTRAHGVALSETFTWWVTPSPRSTFSRYVPFVWSLVFQRYG